MPDDHYAIFKSLTKFSKVKKDEVYNSLGISLNNPKAAGSRLCSPEDFRTTVRDGDLISTNLESFGIPQGTPISALLSNVYMIDFDKIVLLAVESVGGRYYRYCDDMLLIVPVGEMSSIEAVVVSEIKKII